jgi:hypothetical protein
MGIEIDRRSFLTRFGWGAAAAAVPLAPAVVSATPNDTVGPLLLERVCDWFEGYTPEQKAEALKENPGRYAGCGIRFRWYFGSGCMCPQCGWTYCVTLEDIRSKRFQVQA